MQPLPLALIACATTASGQIAWTPAGVDALFSNPANWSGGAVPGTTDDLLFNVAGDYTVRLTAGTLHATAVVTAGNATFDFAIANPSADPYADAFAVSLAGFNDSNASFRVFGGGSGLPSPNLTVTNGILHAQGLAVNGFNGMSTLTVRGAAAEVRSTGTNRTTHLGTSGAAAVRILEGATMRSNTVRAGHVDLVVDGAGSDWIANAFNLGADLPSTLEVRNGGYLRTSLFESRLHGKLTVSGTGSLWRNEGASSFQSAEVRVLDGARVEAQGVDLGVTVTGGIPTNASMRVRGRDAGGTASSFRATNLALGESFTGATARGLLAVEDGAEATVTQWAALGTRHANSLGVLRVSGAGSRFTSSGTGTTHGIVVGGNSSAVEHGAGYLTVEDGGRVSVASANGLRNLSRGHIGGNGTITAPVVSNGGLVSPSLRHDLVPTSANSQILQLATERFQPGTLTIEGNYVQTATGRLNVLLGPSGNDRLHVTGNVSLAGALEATVADGYTPEVGRSYEILSVGGTRTGTFAGLDNGAHLARHGGTDLHVFYKPTGPAGVSLYGVAAPVDLPEPVVDLIPASEFISRVTSALGGRAFRSGNTQTFISNYFDASGNSVAVQSTQADLTRDGRLWVEQRGRVDTRFWFLGATAETYLASSHSLGVLKAEARAETSNILELVPTAFSDNRWWDYYLITGGEGEGTVNFTFKLHGIFGADAESQLFLNVNRKDLSSAAMISERQTRFLHSSMFAGGGEFDETFTASFSFTYGKPFMLDSSLQLYAVGNGSIDFTGTATVLGISVDQGGTIYSAGLIEGAAGPEVYGNTVIPEPAHAALLAALAGLLPLARRICRR